ncbi:hypothetical protein BO85DRAFT_87117 [Aspergillus piperis CBS 112811]|uniref:Uncharacterized protein n=1 Tax=Aspergillus piperis CBS 112811 TaxID=1448313 RepID=A0A8G1QWL5_9EURO|nr:hypothetical protein BO85DRAFT_87117 [Aspergillus piperis CBS 112811]RAH54917.1 hypothetical protein BO85DRAFT_87117 [Aspergillus piperis CBS 112811]
MRQKHVCTYDSQEKSRLKQGTSCPKDPGSLICSMPLSPLSPLMGAGPWLLSRRWRVGTTSSSVVLSIWGLSRTVDGRPWFYKSA